MAPVSGGKASLRFAEKYFDRTSPSKYCRDKLSIPAPRPAPHLKDYLPPESFHFPACACMPGRDDLRGTGTRSNLYQKPTLIFALLLAASSMRGENDQSVSAIEH